jgi:hypothetical protein
MSVRMFSSFTSAPAFLAWILLAASASSVSGQPVRVHLWVKAFIPKTHPTNPGYVKPVPGALGKWMIPGPTPLDQCFFTDHRDFSSDRSASARVTTEFFLVINGNAASTEVAVPERHIHTAGISTKVNCSTGSVIGQKPGLFSRLHSIGSTAPEDAIGRPAVAGTQVQVIFGVATTNPFAPPGISPAIDYSIDYTYDTSSKKLTFAANMGDFPAYEAYAQLGNGPAVTVFRAAPVANTPWGLYDFGTGLNTRRLTGQVVLQ